MGTAVEVGVHAVIFCTCRTRRLDVVCWHCCLHSVLVHSTVSINEKARQFLLAWGGERDMIKPSASGTRESAQETKPLNVNVLTSRSLAVHAS